MRKVWFLSKNHGLRNFSHCDQLVSDFLKKKNDDKHLYSKKNSKSEK